MKQPSQAAKRLNIIVCTCDQLRAFELGCYGNSVIRTPNIDRLASEGVRFEIAVTSRPVCMAARSALLSGQYPRMCTGGVGNIGWPGLGKFELAEYPIAGRPHLKDPTLPEMLRDLGYHNAAIGKWHIHSWPHDIGFDYYLIPRVHHCHTGQSFTENGGPEFVPEGYSVDFECERVERFLQERRKSGQPFFLFYNISLPHCPLSDAPDKYRRMYHPDEIPIRPNVDLEEPLPQQDFWFKVYRWDFRFYNFHLPYTEVLPEDYTLRQLIAEYYGVTTWADDSVGRLLSALDSTGLAENTIVVFTSDHGDNLGSHRWVQKSRLNEESIRIPMILRLPGRASASGRVVGGQVAGHVDLMPTLLELVGGVVPDHVHGQSLAATVRGERQSEKESHAFIETTHGGNGIRTPTHMYALPYAGGPRCLGEAPHSFYDMTQDPYQLRNLAGTGEQDDLAQWLDGCLRRWHENTPWMPGGDDG